MKGIFKKPLRSRPNINVREIWGDRYNAIGDEIKVGWQAGAKGWANIFKVLSQLPYLLPQRLWPWSCSRIRWKFVFLALRMAVVVVWMRKPLVSSSHIWIPGQSGSVWEGFRGVALLEMMCHWGGVWWGHFKRLVPFPGFSVSASCLWIKMWVLHPSCCHLLLYSLTMKLPSEAISPVKYCSSELLWSWCFAVAIEK